VLAAHVEELVDDLLAEALDGLERLARRVDDRLDREEAVLRQDLDDLRAGGGGGATGRRVRGEGCGRREDAPERSRVLTAGLMPSLSMRARPVAERCTTSCASSCCSCCCCCCCCWYSMAAMARGP